MAFVVEPAKDASARAHSLRRTPPLVMGHEFCGVIEDVRGGSGNWKPGQWVIAHAVVHCGECAACRRGDTNLCSKWQIFGMHRPGGFAEFVAVPERVLIPWPEGTPGIAAVLAEPLANGINALRQAPLARKSRVVVIGAGPIGLMCAYAVKQLHGASVIVSDLVPQRLEAARLVGADRVVNSTNEDLAEIAREFWGGEQAEFVMDAVGASVTKRAALELVEPGGGVVWVGLHEDSMELDTYAITLPQKTVAGSYSGSFHDFEQAANILASGHIDTSWISQYELDDAEAGFRDVLGGNPEKIKAIFNMNGKHA